MPPRGWRAPPGYGGYKRRPKDVPERSTRARTAGPALLASVQESGPDRESADLNEDASDDDNIVDDAQVADDRISSRTRIKKGAKERITTGDESDSDGDIPALVYNSTDGESSDDEAPAPVRKKAPAQRSVVNDSDDDPLDDVPRRTAAGNTPYVNTDLPISELSVTLSKSKGHVNPAWLALIFTWMKARTLAAAAALERGGRQQHLHLQAIVRMHIAPEDIDMLKNELKTLVGWRRGDGSGCYCSIKEFGVGQTWMMMLGYIHKDQHQPHFRKVLHNIDPTEILRGIAEWQTAKLSYEDDKIMITKTNLFHRLSTYRLNADPESDNTFIQDMTTMLNSKKYMISTQYVLQSGNVRLAAAEAMYKLVKGVHPMTEEDVQDLFFTTSYTPSRPGAAVPGNRYFDPAWPAHNTSTPTATEGCLAQNNPQGPARRATAETLSPFVRRLFEARSARNSAISSEPGSSMEHASEAVRPDSPRSVDSGSHESDDDFIVADDHISYDDDNSDDDGDTCRPVRPNNGKGRAE